MQCSGSCPCLPAPVELEATPLSSDRDIDDVILSAIAGGVLTLFAFCVAWCMRGQTPATKQQGSRAKPNGKMVRHDDDEEEPDMPAVKLIGEVKISRRGPRDEITATPLLHGPPDDQEDDDDPESALGLQYSI